MVPDMTDKWRAADMHFARMDAEQHLSWRADEDEFDRMFRQNTFAPLGGVFMVWVIVVRGSRRLGRWVRALRRRPETLRLPPPPKALPYNPAPEFPPVFPAPSRPERP